LHSNQHTRRRFGSTTSPHCGSYSVSDATPVRWLGFQQVVVGDGDAGRVPPTNNRAERDLRPLVVLRKITFGHRSDAGANRMGKLMTVGETARRRGHRASEIYYDLYTRPPDRVLRRLYSIP